ncbi:MAG TPA: hypothetical protein VF011_03695 [Terriglobales bacterium]
MKSVAFEWLNKFHQEMEKDPAYAEKTLASYRLGMRGKGSIVGVVVHAAEDCCDAARQLPEDRVYHPDEAPHLPLPQCSKGRRCACVYRPVMTYQSSKKG